MELTKPTREVLAQALKTLKRANIPFLVGGAFAVNCYTGYLRYAKELEVFLEAGHIDEAMARLTEVGFVTKVESPHWLAKAYKDDNLIDLIYGSGNWLMSVDQSFFDRSVGGKVMGVPVQLLAPEEIIWSKSFVQARERFDGADIAHLIDVLQGKLDWNHLLNRFGDNWHLLLSDVLLFSFVYPSDRSYVPPWLMQELIGRMRQLVAEPAPKEKICRGTLLDRYSFVYDVEEEGYKDPREDLAEKQGYGAKPVIEDRAYAKAASLKAFK